MTRRTPPSASTLLTVKDLDKTFTEGKRHTVALRNISFSAEAGEFLVILGPSGCGKSTLLRILCGLETASGGTVTWQPGLTRNDMNFVFQQFALLPWLSVKNNIMLGLQAKDIPPDEREKRVRTELRRFGLEKFAHAAPHELSGGMKQRVGLARALVTRPKVLFMDEPFSELDSFTAVSLRQELLQIWEEQQLTIILVSHLLEEALELADRVVVLSTRPGSVERIVPVPLGRPRPRRSEKLFQLEDELLALVRP